MLIYNGGPVCFNQFSDNAATAVCDKLGYRFGAYEKNKNERAKVAMDGMISCNSSGIFCNDGQWESCNVVENRDSACGGEWYVILSCSINKVLRCQAKSDVPDDSPDTCICDGQNTDKSVVSAILICFSVTMVLICGVLSFFLVKERKKTRHQWDMPTKITFEKQQEERIEEKIDRKKHLKGIPSGYDDLVIKNTSENGGEEEECRETYEGEGRYEDEAQYDEVLVIPNLATDNERDDRKYCVLGEGITANSSENDEEDGAYSKLNKE